MDFSDYKKYISSSKYLKISEDLFKDLQRFFKLGMNFKLSNIGKSSNNHIIWLNVREFLILLCFDRSQSFWQFVTMFCLVNFWIILKKKIFKTSWNFLKKFLKFYEVIRCSNQSQHFLKLRFNIFSSVFSMLE